MAIVLLALLIILILFGLGFALHVLWWIAIIALALWLLGFLFRAGSCVGPRRRCYRWSLFPLQTICPGLSFYSSRTLRVTVPHGS